jgi:hypothetical protein
MDSKATVTEHSSSKDETTSTRKATQTTSKTLFSVYSPSVPFPGVSSPDVSSPGVSSPSVWTSCPNECVRTSELVGPGRRTVAGFKFINKAKNEDEIQKPC